MPSFPFSSIGQFLYVFWAILVFTFFMILFLPFCIIPILVHPSAGTVSFFFFRLWSRLFSVLTGIRYDIEGRGNIQADRPYIFTSNHTSFLDAPGLALAIPMQFRPLGKKELLKIPVFGFIVRVAAVVVNRSDAESRKRSVEKLMRLLRLGISILIFPEGTQNRSSAPLQPFYDGAFRIAGETGTPILPIVILGAGRLLPPGRLTLRPGTIRVIVGSAIEPRVSSEDAEVQRLKEVTFRTMEAMIEAHTDQPGT